MKNLIENIIELANSEDTDKEKEIIRTCEKVLEELNKQKKVQVIFAAEADGDKSAFEVHGIATTQEIADKIIERDVEDGVIHSNAFVNSHVLYDDIAKV